MRLELQVLNPNATGHFTGYTQYSLTYINPASSFFITGQDARVITVALVGGNFSSVATALASITSSSSTNRFVIYVGPGTYNEPALNFIGKQGITVMGYYQTACVLNYSPITANAFITADGDTTFDNLTLRVDPTVDNTNTIITYAGTPTSSQNLRIFNCVFRGGVVGATSYALNTILNCTCTSGNAITLVMLNNLFNPNIYFYTGIHLEDFNASASPLTYTINGLTWGRLIPSGGHPSPYNLTDFIFIKSNSAIAQHVSGALVDIEIGVNIPGADVGNALHIEGSTKTIVQSSIFTGFNNGLYIPNTSIIK